MFLWFTGEYCTNADCRLNNKTKLLIYNPANRTSQPCSLTNQFQPVRLNQWLKFQLTGLSEKPNKLTTINQQFELNRPSRSRQPQPN